MKRYKLGQNCVTDVENNLGFAAIESNSDYQQFIQDVAKQRRLLDQGARYKQMQNSNPQYKYF